MSVFTVRVALFEALIFDVLVQSGWRNQDLVNFASVMNQTRIVKNVASPMNKISFLSSNTFQGSQLFYIKGNT